MLLDPATIDETYVTPANQLPGSHLLTCSTSKSRINTEQVTPSLMLHQSVFVRAIAAALRGVGCSDVACIGDWIVCKRGEACYTLRYAVRSVPGCITRPVEALRCVGAI